MVQLQKYLTRTNPANTEFEQTPLPLLNSLFANSYNMFLTEGEENSFKTYLRWVRKNPHVIGFLNIIATDILSDSITFEAMEGGEKNGRNRIKRANEFWRTNKGLEVVEATIYDMLITGIGYNWIGKVDEKEMREFANKQVQRAGFEKKEREEKADELYELMKNGTVSSLAKKLRHIPSTTVSIKSNFTETEYYVQTVASHRKVFTPDEVVKFSLMPLDGKVYPYPPMESLISEVYLLWLITQNYVSFFENGGHPDKVFILPKEIANSRNHQYLVETLKKYKKIQNKHGNLVFTGDMKVEDLMATENQMQYKDLSLYLVSVLAMMYGIPVGRIPFLVGRAANNGDSGGLADSGYWRKISVWQSKLEEGYNSSVFNPYFGVNLNFRRGYLQDEVRETQTEINKTSVAEQRIRLGLWTVETAGKYLGISEEEVSQAQSALEEREAREMELQTGMMLQKAEKDKDVQWEPDKQNINARRSAKQHENSSSAGKRITP